MGARKRARRRLADNLVGAAYSAHVILHDADLAARPDVIVKRLREWSLSTLRDANRMARLCGAEPLKLAKPARPTLHAIRGGKGGA